MLTYKVSRVAALAALAVVGACHKDSTGPSSSSVLGNYYGVYGASNGSASAGGSLVIIIDVATASGTLTPVGQSGISLTGSYTPSSGAVALTGGGSRTLVGAISGGKLNGSYTGPEGLGTFGTQHGATASDVQLFCGTYGGASSGVWNLSKAGNTLAGAYADDGGGSDELSGSVSGSSINLNFTGGTASGSLTNATTMSGTWTAGADQGTWQGHSPC
jgi:hypothetical protein